MLILDYKYSGKDTRYTFSGERLKRFLPLLVENVRLNYIPSYKANKEVLIGIKETYIPINEDEKYVCALRFYRLENNIILEINIFTMYRTLEVFKEYFKILLDENEYNLKEKMIKFSLLEKATLTLNNLFY